MSVRIMSLVFENQELSATEKLIMLALADHANDEGKSIYPSQARLASKTALTRQTVNKHIQILIDNGYLWNRGYRMDKSNVLELEINVKMLRNNVGVKENDTLKNGEGVKENDRGVSRKATGGVKENDTNHHLTIIKNHQLKKGKPDLFKQCKAIFETKKGKLITDGMAFSLMINNFKKAGVTAEDYGAAIDAMDADKRYNGSKPTSYESWAIGYADKRKNPTKPRKRNRPETAEELYNRLKAEEAKLNGIEVIDG